MRSCLYMVIVRSRKSRRLSIAVMLVKVSGDRIVVLDRVSRDWLTCRWIGHEKLPIHGNSQK